MDYAEPEALVLPAEHAPLPAPSHADACYCKITTKPWLWWQCLWMIGHEAVCVTYGFLQIILDSQKAARCPGCDAEQQT